MRKIIKSSLYVLGAILVLQWPFQSLMNRLVQTEPIELDLANFEATVTKLNGVVFYGTWESPNELTSKVCRLLDKADRLLRLEGRENSHLFLSAAVCYHGAREFD